MGLAVTMREKAIERLLLARGVERFDIESGNNWRTSRWKLPEEIIVKVDRCSSDANDLMEKNQFERNSR